MRSIRVLVVDDSATMRSLISLVLRRDPMLEVVGEAGDPLEARQAIKALNPDVVTLDVEMPNMNGLEFLEKIMRLRPTPVIMVSNLTALGTSATIKALEIGAFDCIAKPSPGDEEIFDGLAAKVRAAAGARMRPAGSRRSALREKTAIEAAPKADSPYCPDRTVVAIGSSTGGVEALIAVLSVFPANCPPTVITQHMPATFTKSFAERLNRLCVPAVSEAVDGASLETGHVYLAPGGITHLEIVGSGTLRCRLRQGDPVNGHRPSVDVLFASVAKAAGPHALGVILTGMGRDGAEGLLAMRRAGAKTLGQDEATSLVYGMPKAAFEIGAIEKQAPLNRIGTEILRVTSLEGEGRCLLQQQ
jgi:two-component system chemotaxis response regulator CheB